MNLRKLLHTCLVLLIMPLVAFSGVNLKNGNYYVSYTDHENKTSFSAFKTIVRTYNSKAIGVGLFGYGWGSDMETKLMAYPDGFLVIHENGLGARAYCIPEIVDEGLIEMMIDQLVDVVIEHNEIKNNPAAILKFRESMADLDKRSNKWDKYVEMGVLSYSKEIFEGMEWRSTSFGNHLITFKNDEFTRKKGSTLDAFNMDGKLIRLDEGNGKWSRLEYENGFLSKIVNADGSFYTIKTNSKGLILEITSASYYVVHRIHANKHFRPHQRFQSGRLHRIYMRIYHRQMLFPGSNLLNWS